MYKNAARILIAGTGSGCGKTTVVCAVLQALKNRGCNVASFKCGPDYIDPMFHSEIIGTQSTNIDLFFSEEKQARSLFVKHVADLNVIEGVMGFYDGMRMDDTYASGYHIAQTLNAPAILVVNVRGMALSASAVVSGFLNLRKPSGIAGVIFNNATETTYPLLKKSVENECGVRVYGYLPMMKNCALESRHLGLVTAQEIDGLHAKLQALSKQAEKSIDLDGLIELMRNSSPIETAQMRFDKIASVRIAVAKDRAFCFYYRDNLEMLEEMGAEIVCFSPLSDKELPECDGLILGGGYPELYARELSENECMRKSIHEAVQNGLPTIAECGGFMYLTQEIAGFPMVGIVDGGCFNTGKLCRFGYVTLQSERDTLLLAKGESVRAHEFHYWDAEKIGADLCACKPSGKSWRCAYASQTLYAGYPHLYFPSRPEAAKRFINKCLERKKLYETYGNRKTEF